MGLTLLSEPYSPAGSMVAKTLTRAVRNTSLDEWSVLLRETLQNSFDARIAKAGPIDYFVSLDWAEERQRDCLREEVFTDIPRAMQHLAQALKLRDLPLLVIADWGTRGLCGPTRADLEAKERTDFQDFFLNVGREDTKAYQGGTFGLGRGVLFDISRGDSIVVYTRTTSEGKAVSRLIAMGISESHVLNGRKFTGRHWWASASGREWPEPITGSKADRLARRLGLDVIPQGDTGTAIMVVAPRIPESWSGDDSLSLSEALDAMIEAARLYGWPLMVGRKGKPEVDFLFSHNGETWTPSPPDSEDSPVRDFVEAYRRALLGGTSSQPTSWHHREITFGDGRARPKQLGSLVFRHFPPLPDASDEHVEEQIPRASIALMRDPRMVVKYLAVPMHPMGSATRGVFVLDSSFDQQFAESEPVAHDEWIPAKIASAKYARNPVKQALEKIKQEVKETLTPSRLGAPGASGADDLAPVIADLLGGMLADASGSGAGKAPRTPSGGRGGGASRGRSIEVNPPLLRVASDGGLEAVFPVRATVTSGRSAVLRAEPQVVLDSGLESVDQRPEGSEWPELIGWESPEGARLGADSEFALDGGTTDLRVVLRQPVDVATTVTITFKEEPRD